MIVPEPKSYLQCRLWVASAAPQQAAGELPVPWPAAGSVSRAAQLNGLGTWGYQSDVFCCRLVGLFGPRPVFLLAAVFPLGVTCSAFLITEQRVEPLCAGADGAKSGALSAKVSWGAHRRLFLSAVSGTTGARMRVRWLRVSQSDRRAP